MRGRGDDRLVPRQPVDDDVQERAEDRAENSGESDGLHGGLIGRPERRLSAERRERRLGGRPS